MSSCETIPVPKGEECFNLEFPIIVGDEEHGCFCINTLYDKEDPRREYTAPCVGWTVVSPERRKELQEHYDEVARRLLVCLDSPKKCQ